MNEVKPDSKHTALHLAAIKGHNASLEALLSWGAEVNPQCHTGGTPLQAACQEGHLLCVLTLLKAGASLTLPARGGALPIHLAAQYNRVEVVKAFLEHGCNPDMVSWYGTEYQLTLFLSAKQQNWADTTAVRSNASS